MTWWQILIIVAHGIAALILFELSDRRGDGRLYDIAICCVVAGTAFAAGLGAGALADVWAAA